MKKKIKVRSGSRVKVKVYGGHRFARINEVKGTQVNATTYLDYNRDQNAWIPIGQVVEVVRF